MAAATSVAQPGRVAAGLRDSPDGVGASAKFFFNHYFAFETQLAYGGFFFHDGKSAYTTGLLEYHLPLPAPAWRLYFGGGAHVGYWWGRGTHKDEIMVGLDGIAGIEYLVHRTPFGLSFDLKPPLNFIEDVEFFPHGFFGAGLRYYFGKWR